MADTINFSTNGIGYDQVVTNLKNYLQYQKEFSDYQFEGSALSTLISLLAYNTHYNLVYDNFAINESFLDSAVKPASVISHASLLNYIPSSAKSAKATVNITVVDNEVTANSPSEYYLPANSIFWTNLNGEIYNFFNESPVVFKRSGSYFTCRDVILTEGTPVVNQFAYSGDSLVPFIIENENADIDSLIVSVQIGDKSFIFEKAENIMGVNKDSKVYFLTANNDGRYSIQFGNGVFGYSLTAGDIITIKYNTTHGSAGNGAGSFAAKFTGKDLGFSNSSLVQITCSDRSMGGSNRESIESIKTFAPKIYTTQGRCVTENDFKAVVMSEFPNARSVRAWGGEQNIPPEYGKTFISVIPKVGNTLTDGEKKFIKQLFENRKLLTNIVEVVNPSIIKINVSTNVYFDGNKTNISADDIKAAVTKTIIEFNNQNLVEFGNKFKYSKLVTAIDDTYNIIDNNSTTIKLALDVDPMFNILTGYTVDCSNSIFKSVTSSEYVLSSGFTCVEVPNRVCYIDDDPVLNVLRLFYYDENNNKTIVQSIGTIDYQSGLINIDPLTITNIAGSSWTFSINPKDNDVVTKQNQFCLIDQSNTVVSVVDTSYDEK